MTQDPLNEIITKLNEITRFPERMRGEDTEIFYDTRVYGEDAWELFDFIVDRFDTDLSSLHARDYVPNEGDLRLWLVIFGRRPFKSLTAGHLAKAAEVGEWYPSG